MKARTILLLTALWAVFAVFATAETTPKTSTPSQRTLNSYAKLPLTFEANQGQANSQVRYISRGNNYTFFLTQRAGAVLQGRRGDHIRITPLDAHHRIQAEGLNELPGKTNYFLGRDPKNWHQHIPTFAKVRYKDVYPGIDLVYYGNDGKMEYDFVLHPGADPRVIDLKIAGAHKVAVDAEGELLLQTKSGTLRQLAPMVYQEHEGKRIELAGRYVVKGKDRIGFSVAAYDRSQMLTIDPVLLYSTYFGGGDWDYGNGVVDTMGNLYFAGATGSLDFPTTSGSFQTAISGVAYDAYIVKLDPTGSTILYSTFIGGSSIDGIGRVQVDAAGNVYAGGGTNSTDFPITQGSFQTTYGGGAGDDFVIKLDPTGSTLLYSTFLGGNSDEDLHGFTIDSVGNAYVLGSTYSSNFPVTPGCLQPTHHGGVADAIVVKLDPMGAAVYSTYLGGSGREQGRAIAADASGNAYLLGVTTGDFPTTAGAFQPIFAGNLDLFVAKLNPTGSSLVYSTYLGGSGWDGSDSFGAGNGAIAVDLSGSAYIASGTSSADFPVTMGSFQTVYGGGNAEAFVAKLNPAGSALVYSTFLGGSGADAVYGMAIDTVGNVYVGGLTTSADFPTVDAFQTTHMGERDGFVTELNASGSALVFSSYLGGTSFDVVGTVSLDAAGNIYVVGGTSSTDFRVVNALQANLNGSSDVFLAKIGPSGNTPAGTNVTVDLSVTGLPNVTLAFSDVVTAGNTTLAPVSNGQPLPTGEFKLTPQTKFELSTTAVLSGSITVCIPYNSTNSKLMHYVNGAWVDTHATLSGNLLCGTVTSFSPFAMAEPNLPPVASIAPIQTAILGESLIFNGSASADPDGTIAGYAWIFGDGGVASGTAANHTYVSAGTFQVTLTVTDNDGATGTATVTATVETPSQAINDLIAVVESMNLAQGIENALDVKLQNAAAALDAENAANRADAVNKLYAFVSATQAQSGNKLTVVQANQLITAANRIITSLL